jgi:predicted permease
MRAVKKWLGWIVPPPDRALVLRELDDLFARKLERSGPFRAALWYALQLVSFAVRLRIEPLRESRAGLPAFLSDVAFSTRALLRRPGFLVAGVVTLGVGTGGVAAVYGAADWVLLRDVPGVGAPEQLVWLRLESNDPESWGGNTWGIMHPDFERLGERLTSLTGFEAAREHDVHLQVADGALAERERATLVTPGYFDLLEMTPVVGRFFSRSDHAGGEGPAEVVIGYDLWRRGWARSPAAVGSEVFINRARFTVIGVAPEGFRGAELPGTSDVWLTTSAFATVRPAEAASGIDQAVQLWDRLIGRRVSASTPAEVERQANEAVRAIQTDFSGEAHSFLADHFVFRAYEGIGLDPGLRAEARRTLAILLAASAFLLALAIGNVANLGLTRAASRRGTSAIRRALGAGAWRVAREPLIEGGLVGALGGALGLLLLWLGSGTLGRVSLVGGDAGLEGLRIEPRVATVTVLVALAAGLLSGVVPAIAVRRERALTWLAGSRRSDRSVSRTRSLLVVGQIAVSGALLIGAGLFGRTVTKLNAIDLAVSRDTYLFSVDPGMNGYDEPQIREVLSQVREDLWDAWGAESAGIVFPGPMFGWRITGTLRPAGAPEDEYAFGSTFWTSGNGFFNAVGMELIAGSGFVQDLRAPEADGHPVVINQSMAEAAFPQRAPTTLIGAPVIVGRDDFESTIVGVVRDARIIGPLQPPSPIVFRPWDSGWSDGSATFAVRTNVSVGEMRSAVTGIVTGVDASLPTYDASTIGSRADTLLSGTRVVSGLATVLGIIGLILVSLGLYGVLSYAVQERTHEFGVRVALGASGNGIRREVLVRGLRLSAGGLLVGIPVAAWLTRYVESQLYEMSALDLPTYSVGVVVILVVTVAASWGPARRATSISPVEALRRE